MIAAIQGEKCFEHKALPWKAPVSKDAYPFESENVMRVFPCSNPTAY